MSCVLGCSHGDDELLNFNSLHFFFFFHFPPASRPELCPVGGTGARLVRASKTSNYRGNGRELSSCCACAGFHLFIFFFLLGVDETP